MRILLVDDHAMVRRGLRETLTDEGLAAEFGEADCAAAALRLAREQAWDLMILDLALPDRGGGELLKQIKRDQPNLPVLVLSMYPEDQYAVRMLKAGAGGYLTKESAPDQLAQAVRTLLAGRRFITPAVAELLVEQVAEPHRELPEERRHERLSDREFEVFRLLAAGVGVTAIGERLNLSVKTIATYRARVLEKMGAASNAQLTLYASRLNLLE